MFDWIDRLFNEHKLVRRGLVIWAVWIITWVVVTVFKQLSLITTPVATFGGVVIGMLATVLAFYQWSRDKDDEDLG